jgi:hypothetical protein
VHFDEDKAAVDSMPGALAIFKRTKDPEGERRGRFEVTLRVVLAPSKNWGIGRYEASCTGSAVSATAR